MSSTRRWLELLDDEDLAFLKRFVLASGSLKELAEAYSISYPTVRLRLDQLIAKIQVFDSQTTMSDFERMLRGLHIDGKIDLPTLKTLLAAHQKEKLGTQTHAPDTEKNHETPVKTDADRGAAQRRVRSK